MAIILEIKKKQNQNHEFTEKVVGRMFVVCDSSEELNRIYIDHSLIIILKIEK